MTESLEELFGGLSLTQSVQFQLLGSLAILAALWLLRLFVLRAIESRYREDPRSLYYWRKASGYIIFAIGLILIGSIWLPSVQSLATFLGLVSAGLAIALQDLVVNMVGWLFINWRRPFVQGDRIQIGQHAGDVIDVRLFEFTLLEIGNWVASDQSTGRVIHVPNGQVFREPLANYSQGMPYIWNEIAVLITFESNWRQAKAILSQLLQKHASQNGPAAPDEVLRHNRRFLITYANVTPTIYTRVESSGVQLTMRYMVDPRQRRDSERILWEAVLAAFETQTDIEFAYETRRQYQAWHESKSQRLASERVAEADDGVED